MVQNDLMPMDSNLSVIMSRGAAAAANDREKGNQETWIAGQNIATIKWSPLSYVSSLNLRHFRDI